MLRQSSWLRILHLGIEQLTSPEEVVDGIVVFLPDDIVEVYGYLQLRPLQQSEVRKQLVEWSALSVEGKSLFHKGLVFNILNYVTVSLGVVGRAVELPATCCILRLLLGRWVHEITQAE